VVGLVAFLKVIGHLSEVVLRRTTGLVLEGKSLFGNPAFGIFGMTSLGVLSVGSFLTHSQPLEGLKCESK